CVLSAIMWPYEKAPTSCCCASSMLELQTKYRISSGADLCGPCACCLSLEQYLVSPYVTGLSTLRFLVIQAVSAEREVKARSCGPGPISPQSHRCEETPYCGPQTVSAQSHRCEETPYCGPQTISPQSHGWAVSPQSHRCEETPYCGPQTISLQSHRCEETPYCGPQTISPQSHRCEETPYCGPQTISLQSHG
ncbi:hypothetical protein STEG23_035508, partial [Scotinomys teguina]